MKKLIGTAMLAALLATSAFAELSISGGATQLWSPVAYNGGDVLTGSQCPWGGGRTGSVGFTWVSEDGKAGTSLAFVYNPWNSDHAEKDAGISSDGSRVIWLKPWDFLKLTLGHWDGVNDISLVNTSSWDWLRPSTWFDGDAHLYSENEHTGAMIEITPIDDLVVRVGLPFENPEASYKMFEKIHAEVEYTIADILGLKVAWLGGANDHRDAKFYEKDGYKSGSNYINVGEVDVYANLLAVENLQLAVGARINILNADYVTTQRASSLIGLKAGYNITDRFSVKADFGVVTYKKFASTKYKPDFQFGVGVGVGLTDSLSLDADFRGLLKGDVEVAGVSTDGGDPTFSFLVGLKYACSTNATVGIGFQGKTNGGKIGPLSANSDNFGFAVPILVNVSF